MKKYISIIGITIFMILVNILPVYADGEFSDIKAKIVKNNGIEEVKKENEPTKKVQNITVRILEGEYENEEYEMTYVITENIDNYVSNIELKEDDNVLVKIEEKEGEITNISFIKMLKTNYIICIVACILVLILIIVNRKRAIIIYLITTILVGVTIVYSIQNGWNLILISSIISLIITMVMFISVNGMRKETLELILKAILGISVSGILMYTLFSIMDLNNINIKITQSLVNVKDLICSGAILVSCGIYNAIMISAQYIFYANNKPYKIKSDNIIEGQRSLKL